MIEADYVIVGSGASGLAFADVIAERSDRTMVIVDRHDRPGGHWNDAYRFVRLHQPSTYYGVNSLELSDGAVDTTGTNAGLLSLASGAEVSAYFDRVMEHRLLPTGRVTYLPSHQWDDDGRARPLFGGAAKDICARRIVDTSFYATAVPSTHPPGFQVEDGARLAIPNDLPGLWKMSANLPGSFCIIGAGKTACDVANWLLAAGVDPDSIGWVRPRDSWFYNRAQFQTGLDRAPAFLQSQINLMNAFGVANDMDALFGQLEADGYMLRIDRAVRPTMFHYATSSALEIERLAAIRRVYRHGRVAAIRPGRIDFVGGERETLPEDTMFIDCSASAISRRPSVPVWQNDRITVQMVRAAQPTFSAALIAFLELALSDDDLRNAAARPIPLPDTLAGFAESTLVNLFNQQAWMTNDVVREFIMACRLDGYSKTLASLVERDDSAGLKMAALRQATREAVPNMTRLASGAAA